MICLRLIPLKHNLHQAFYQRAIFGLMLSSKLFTSTDCKNGLDAKMSKMPTQKAPLGHLLPSHPLIRSQLFCRGIFSSHFSPVAKYSIDKQAKFHDQGQTADGQFGKYIGLHFFPLRRLLVDNCVESSVNYKKIFGGFTLPDLNLFPISAMEMLKAFSVIPSMRLLVDLLLADIKRKASWIRNSVIAVSQPPRCWLHVPLCRVSAASAFHSSCKSEFLVKILSTVGVSPFTPLL